MKAFVAIYHAIFCFSQAIGTHSSQIGTLFPTTDRDRIGYRVGRRAEYLSARAD